MRASTRHPFALQLAGMSWSAIAALVLTMAPSTTTDAQREDMDA